MDPTRFPAFATYAVFAVALCLFLMVLDSLPAVVRAREKKTLNPEDKKLNPTNEVVDDEPARVARSNRVFRNANVNVIPFLFIAYLFVLTGASKQSALIYFGTFTAARVAHAIVYSLALQPWRTVFFVVGQLVTGGLAVRVLLAVV